MDLIAATGAARNSAIIDVGGGASRLVDALVERGFRSITVLDLSDSAWWRRLVTATRMNG
jgi:hypothetical protein